MALSPSFSSCRKRTDPRPSHALAFIVRRLREETRKRDQQERRDEEQKELTAHISSPCLTMEPDSRSRPMSRMVLAMRVAWRLRK